MNQCVKDLQMALLGLGYDPGVIDGVYGVKTHQANMKAIHGELGGNGLGANGAKVLGEKGLALIKSFEGLSLDAYPDPGTGGEPVTIGYGHTGGIKMGARITEKEATGLLRMDVKRFEDAVNKLAPVATQNQFDALVSLAFNVGEGNLKTSTLLKMHNAGDYAGAKQQFIRWNRAAGKVMNGLTRRREAEAKLYGEP